MIVTTSSKDERLIEKALRFSEKETMMRGYVEAEPKVSNSTKRT
jgi:hypothetical protein